MLVNYGPSSQISSSEFLLRVSQLEKSDFEQTTKLAQIEGNINSITSTVQTQTENINGISSQTSTLAQTVSDFTARIEKVEGANKDYTEIKATLDGLTITTENGKTIIDGGNIDATNLNLTGSIIFSDIADGTSSVNNLITNNTTVSKAASDAGDALSAAVLAQQAAEDAENAVVNTSNIMTSWINGSTNTTIDGSSVKTPSIYTKHIHMGGNLTVYTTETGATKGGFIGYAPSKNDGTPGMRMASSNETSEFHVTNNGAFMRCQGTQNQIGATASGVGVTAQGTNYYFGSTALYPETSGSRYLGLSANRWNTVYISSGTIQTSDRNQKNSIESLPDKYIALFDNLEAKRYKMNDGTSGRYHVGFIAQDVEEAMAVVGIDSQDFGGFVKDKDENDNDTYMLRYDEFIGILTAKIKQLESRIEQLEAN